MLNVNHHFKLDEFPYPEHEPETVLQYDKRYFGKFRCTDCASQWVSACSWLGFAQKCEDCALWIYPKILSKLEIPSFSDGNKKYREDKSHIQERCERCRRLGYCCRKSEIIIHNQQDQVQTTEIGQKVKSKTKSKSSKPVKLKDPLDSKTKSPKQSNLTNPSDPLKAKPVNLKPPNNPTQSPNPSNLPKPPKSLMSTNLKNPSNSTKTLNLSNLPNSSSFKSTLISESNLSTPTSSTDSPKLFNPSNLCTTTSFTNPLNTEIPVNLISPNSNNSTQSPGPFNLPNSNNLPKTTTKLSNFKTPNNPTQSPNPSNFANSPKSTKSTNSKNKSNSTKSPKPSNLPNTNSSKSKLTSASDLSIPTSSITNSNPNSNHTTNSPLSQSCCCCCDHTTKNENTQEILTRITILEQELIEMQRKEDELWKKFEAEYRPTSTGIITLKHAAIGVLLCYALYKYFR